MCGGIEKTESGYAETSECFKWTYGSGEWLRSPNISAMNVSRNQAGAVQLGDNFWMTGGKNADSSNILSTELRSSDGTWTFHDDLPLSMYGHCMARINNTHVISVGGHNSGGLKDLKKAYMYSISGGWQTLTEMGTKRNLPACSVLGDNVFVAGGWNGGKITSTEIYSISSNQWQAGPALPKESHQAKMITIDNAIYHIGGQPTEKDILRLDPDDSTSSGWTWTKVGNLTMDKRGLDVIPISEC